MPRHPPCALRSLSPTNSQRRQRLPRAVWLVLAATKTSRSPEPSTANRERAVLIESDRKRDIPGGGCREDARVHYEVFNVPARRADPTLAHRCVLVGDEVQVPDDPGSLISQSSTVCQDLEPPGRPQVPRRERQY